MTPAEWSEAMRVARERVDVREAARRLCCVALVRIRKSGKRGAVERAANSLCDTAYKRLHKAQDELRRVRALRPEGAIDWVDGMGRQPVLMPTEIDEAAEAEGVQP